MLTREELIICQIELRKRGYAYFYVFGTGRDGFTLRARRWAPLSARGLAEQPIEIRLPADLAAHLR